MKGYALLLGAVITGLYGYGVQAAIAADLARAETEMIDVTSPAETDRIWYGGTLAVVRVEGWRLQPSAISQQPSAGCDTPVRKG